MKRWLVLLFLVAGSGCGNDLPHDSPFDPESPLDKQAKATISGSVRLAGESDATGVDVQLQNAAHTFVAQTDGEGNYRLTGVVPGSYALRLSTRYFSAWEETVTIGLGSEHTMPVRELAASTARVKGSALIERRVQGAPVTSGGVTLLLKKTGSIRGATQAAPGLLRTAAAGESETVETVSGDDGAFALEEVPAGVYELSAETADSANEIFSEVRVDGETAEVAVEPIMLRPLTGFFQIETDGNLGVTNNPVATLLLSGFNATGMRLGTSADGTPEGCGFLPEKPYQAVDVIVLPGEGENTVCVFYTDEKGRQTETLTRTVVLDTQGPAVYDVAVNEGAPYSRSNAVRLEIDAADLTSGIGGMQVSATAAFQGAVTEPFVPSALRLLSAGDGVKTVYLRLIDRAGNFSATFARTITVDTSLSASLSAQLKDSMGRTSATDQELVSLIISGLTADVHEIIVAANSGFAGSIWTPVTSSVIWQLPTGDGVKTVYAKGRDAAGNESPLLQASITLDQSGPDTPGLNLFDIDGDGIALTNTAVELQWSVPGAADLAGFELQRYVQGIDFGFVSIANVGPTVDEWQDDVTDSVGYPHYYRIRAYDSLGNSSGWSVNAEANPFAPIDGAYWIFTETGVRYVFNPQPGTYSLRPVYQYENFVGDLFVQELNTDVAYWDRVTSGDIAYNESLLLKTVNRDNSLAYITEVPLDVDTREKAAAGGRFAAMAQASDGTLHMVMSGGVTNSSGMSYVRRSSEGAETTRIHFQSEDLFFTRAGAIALGANGGLYAAFVTADTNFAVYYLSLMRGMAATSTTVPIAPLASFPSATNVGLSLKSTSNDNLVLAYSELNTVYLATENAGAWSVVPLFSGTLPSMVLDASDNVHYCSHLGNTVTYYNNVAGWYSSTVTTSGRYCALALDSNGNPVVAYLTASVGGALNVARWSGSAWTYEIAHQEPATAIPFGTGMFIDASGALHLTYDSGGNSPVLYVTNSSGGWTSRAIDTGNSTPAPSAVAVSEDGSVNILYYHTLGTENRFVKLAGSTLRREPVPIVNEWSVSYQIHNGANWIAYQADSTDFTRTELWIANDANGAWAEELVSADTYPGELQLKIDRFGRAHVLFAETASGALVYANNALGGVWTTQVLGAAGNYGYDNALAVDADGLASALFWDPASGLVTLAQDNGVTWSYTVFPGVQNAGDLVVDAVGAVHIAASKTTLTDLYYITNRYGGWTTESVDLGTYASLALDSSGAAHIAYFRWQPTYDLGYATNKHGTWTSTVVDTFGDTGFYPQILLDSHERVHVIYREDSNRRIRYAVNIAGGWSTARIAPIVGNYAAALDDEENVVLLYGTVGLMELIRGFQGVLPASSIRQSTAW